MRLPKRPNPLTNSCPNVVLSHFPIAVPNELLRVRQVARVAGGFGADVTKLEGHARSFTRLIKAAPHRQHAQWSAVVVLDQERALPLALAGLNARQQLGQLADDLNRPFSPDLGEGVRSCYMRQSTEYQAAISRNRPPLRLPSRRSRPAPGATAR